VTGCGGGGEGPVCEERRELADERRRRRPTSLHVFRFLNLSALFSFVFLINYFNKQVGSVGKNNGFYHSKSSSNKRIPIWMQIHSRKERKYDQFYGTPGFLVNSVYFDAAL
jgi:hypothetical protein